jgi:hypothetical protein
VIELAAVDRGSECFLRRDVFLSAHEFFLPCRHFSISPEPIFAWHESDEQGHCTDHYVQPRDGVVDVQELDDQIAHARDKAQHTDRQQQDAEKNAKASRAVFPSSKNADNAENDVDDGMRPIRSQTSKDHVTR